MFQEFSLIKEHVDVIFEHTTDIPGLSDCLKHLEGFYNICQYSGALFYKNQIRNSRSQMDDCDDPASLIGLDTVISELNYSARKLRNSQKENNLLYIDVNFNELVSGESNAHVGSHKVNHLSFQEKLKILLENIVVLLLKRCGVENLENLISFLLSNDIKVLTFRFTVHHISIISQFITDNDNFRRMVADNAHKVLNTSDSDDTFNITIHFRQGDTSVFQLPDGRLVSAWGNWKERDKSSNPEFLDSLSQAAYQQYSLSDFLRVVKDIIDENKDQKLHINFISDGFSRGIERIIQFNDLLLLSNEELNYIKKWAEQEEKDYMRQLKAFANEHDINIHIAIGENKESFQFSVRSIAESNVLVAGVGGFSRTMFSYLSRKTPKLLIEKFDSTNS